MEEGKESVLLGLLGNGLLGNLGGVGGLNLNLDRRASS